MFRFITKKLSVLFVIVGLLSLENCQFRENAPLQQESKSTFDFGNAESVKNWFEKQILLKSNQRIQADAPSRLFRWNEHFYYLLGGEKVLLVPIGYSQNITPVLRGSDKSKKKSTPDSYNASLNELQYLVIKQNGTNDIMTLYPTDDFLQKSQRRKKPFPYSGLIVFEDLGGSLKGGYSYDKGKVNGEVLSQKAKNARLNDYIQVECSTIDIYSCASANGGQTWDCQYSYTKEECTSMYVSSGGGGSNGSGGYGGGGGGYGDFAGYNDPLASYLEDSRVLAFYNSIPQGEKDFYNKNPHLIIGVALNRLTALNLIAKHYGINGQANNNNGNAYFHAVWSYLNAASFGAEDAKTIGDIHEKYDPSNAHPSYSAMDKHNNNLGITIWNNYSSSNFWSPVIGGLDLVANAIINGQGVRVIGYTLVPTTSEGFTP